MALAMCGCLWVIWTTVQWSYSRILGRYALGMRSQLAANESLRFAPTDAEAHFTKAVLLKVSGQLAPALVEFERAAAMRPRDYYVWLELGMARDEYEDATGALAAFDEAVRLAPHYAQTRWQRGNLLIRMRRYDEAFADLRLAADSNPDLVPNLMDLAWGLAQGDAKLAEQLGNITTPQRHVAFALYLARRGKGKEALEQFKAAETITEEQRRRLVTQLIETKNYAEAYQVWIADTAREGRTGANGIYDGGFELTLNLSESAFGWRVPRQLAGLELSLDTVNPHSGSRSLLIKFTGESNPGSPGVSQMLLVEPGKTYSLSYAVRAKEIVTGGLPLLVVNDVDGDRRVLGKSAPFPVGDESWQGQSFSFTTGPTTTAVMLSLQRLPCASSPCPAFGSIWLDSFGLRLTE